MISIRLPQDVLQRLDEWIASQQVPPKRTSVILHALSDFLDRADTTSKPRQKPKKKA